MDDNTIKCSNCGAELKFAPGTKNLKCEFCSTENEIEIDQQAQEEAHRENDFYSYLNSKKDKAAEMTVSTVNCTSCGAKSTFDPNQLSGKCDFCGTPLVSQEAEETSIIKPQGVIPFVVTEEESHKLYKQWLKKLWFAPNKLKKYATQTGAMSSIYIPFWTYDCQTYSSYSGERGIDYTEEEEYTDEDGETQTRSVTRTDWTYVTGNVSSFFDDVTVPATNSLPVKHVDNLGPWEFSELTAYDNRFFRGHKAETYQVSLEEGFENAKVKIDSEIRENVRRDIGGDRQRINNVDTRYEDITFKHIMLPIWLNAYRYKNKTYRFFINGQTGKVKGERPYSWIKITLATLLGLGIIGGLIWYFNYYN